MRDGMAVLIRPLKPEDAALYPDFMADITPEDVRLRFFVPMREINPAIVDRLIHYDPAHAMAFIAIAEATGKMLGVVRLHDDPDGRSAEYAILVRSHLKGHGLGWLLMQRIIDYARRRGLQSIYGQVLADNTTMLRMCKELGFEISDEIGERDMKRATFDFAQAA